MRVALVVGTRPEVIKMAPVWFALKKSVQAEPFLISTGQHREMLDHALGVFGLKPDVDLGLMQPNQTLARLTSSVIEAVSAALRQHKPAAVLVQGDTTSALGAAMASFYERIPVGHVEAGLRTYNFEAPWPEEMNRRLVDPISRWCFAPTDWSRANLLAERIPEKSIAVTGNTVIDALLWVREKLKGRHVSSEEVALRCQIPEAFWKRYLGANGSEARRWILVTGHRRESFGAGFENICQAIGEVARRHPDVGLLYPVHLNPNVQEPVRRLLGGNPRIALIPPVAYEDFIWLMERSYFIVSDSGGVQEEAPSLGKPVLVLRERTERPEGVEGGTCRLVGTDPAKILSEAAVLLENPAQYKERSELKNPYGDGSAGERIARIVVGDLAAD